MDKVMPFQFILPVKQGPTSLTFKRFLSSMNEIVRFQVVLCLEVLVTGGTGVQS